jgi:uncharacterized Zn-binding protein involved in type VI secretion
MKIIGWIRQGDKAACGGTVSEGSTEEFSGGVGYAFQGAHMVCSGSCVIAEGYPNSTLSNGKPQVLHGQLTSGGCALFSTLNEIDGVANEGGRTV